MSLKVLDELESFTPVWKCFEIEFLSVLTIKYLPNPYAEARVAQGQF